MFFFKFKFVVFKGTLKKMSSPKHLIILMDEGYNSFKYNDIFFPGNSVLDQ